MFYIYLTNIFAGLVQQSREYSVLFGKIFSTTDLLTVET